MTKVFINAKGTVGDITPELKKFLKMVSRHEATDDFTRKLHEIIYFFHMDDNTRDSYMTLEMKILEETKYIVVPFREKTKFSRKRTTIPLCMQNSDTQHIVLSY